MTRENWDGAGLLDLVNQAMELFGVANGRTERFVITGKNIRLPPNVTLALGIAFHELATNAVKYGAFSNEAGSILLAWTVEPTPKGDRLILRWQEKDGPPVTPPIRKGFGSPVIERGLPHELQGTVNSTTGWRGVVWLDQHSWHRAVLVMNKLLSGRRVLVVEDEMNDHYDLSKTCWPSLGCELLTAAATCRSGHFALIDTQVFDAAMVDINLNGNKKPRTWPTRSPRATCRSSSRPVTALST